MNKALNGAHSKYKILGFPSGTDHACLKGRILIILLVSTRAFGLVSVEGKVSIVEKVTNATL
jgi:hypothetical protein